MEYVLLVVLATIASIFLIGSYFDLHIDKDLFSKVWKLVVIVSFFLALIFEPNPYLDFDLLRINARLYDIRNFGLEESLKFTDIENLYIFKYWLYIVSMLDCDGLLTAVPFAMDVFIFGCIICDLIKNNNNRYRIKHLTFALITWMSLIGIKLAVTDIRCVFAMTICSFALFREYIMKKRRASSYTLYVISMFVHHYTIIFLLIRLLIGIFEKLNNMYRFMLLSAFIAMLPVAITLLSDYSISGFDYLNIALDKLAGASNRSYFIYREMSQRLLYLSMIAILLYTVCFTCKEIYRINKFQGKDTVYFRSNISLYLVSLFLLGFFQNYLILERGMYIISILYPINYLLTPCQRIAKRKDYIIIPLLMYILFINDINAFIVNKLGYSYLKM